MSRPFRAFTFAGGGFDTVMQLGVAHALLVARGTRPDCIVGISAGAVNATAVAEILLAGNETDSREQRLSAKVDRFREFVQSYVEVPLTLIDALIPDSLEVTNKSPLRVVTSPLAHTSEHKAKVEAAAAKTGIIKLLNDFFDARLTVSSATILTRRVLGWIEAGEKSTWWARFSTRVHNEAGLLAFALRHAAELAPIFWRLVTCALRSERKSEPKDTAGHMITKWRWLRRVRNRLIAFPLQLVAFLVLLVAAGVAWLEIGIILGAFFSVRRTRSIAWLSTASNTIVDRVLAHYGIRDSLANPQPIREALIRLFDPRYYGASPVGEVLANALDSKDGMLPDPEVPKRKTVGHYANVNGDVRMHVAPVAADIASGELRVLPDNVPIVDALLAATAIVPVFPAVQPIPDDNCWFIDGINVSNQPISPMLDHVRSLFKQNPELAKTFTSVDVYQVTPFPISSDRLEGDAVFDGVIAVAQRARELKNFRDAKLEQKLTGYYSDLLPEGKAFVEIQGEMYLSTNIMQVELQTPPRLNELVFQGTATPEMRNAIHAAIADGCRAALEAITPGAMQAEAERILGVRAADAPALSMARNIRVDVARDAEIEDTFICSLAIQKRFGTKEKQLAPDDAGYPGLKEICANCKYATPAHAAESKNAELEVAQKRVALSLLDRLAKRHPKPVADWPIDSGLDDVHAVLTFDTDRARKTVESFTREMTTAEVVAQRHVSEESSPSGENEEQKLVPAPSDEAKPLVSMLFGGGVFRGVFHMGVVNALNELTLEPDIVAGSSVGSIVAAMIAAVFTTTDPDVRKLQIARLAATFLSIDRLVLTDRCTDFVRRFTLRAAEANFSPHDLDRVFRRFERATNDEIGDDIRRVAAGFERLLYITPFELIRLAELYRTGDMKNFGKDLQRDIQDFFDRGGVGLEILGSEPLQALIELHVLERLRNEGDDDPRFIRFDRFGEAREGRRPVKFFATATNLTAGRLEILHGGEEPSILYGLLASSAFPTIFRPRFSWEVFLNKHAREQFIDGGVIDNLPLDKVTTYLHEQLRGNARRPTRKGEPVPHLMFTASLEVDPQVHPPASWPIEAARRSWRTLSARAATFAYNRKIDAYARVQRDLRRIWKSASTSTKSVPPVDIHLLAVKPKWLCDTFGFHPMIGFKRWKQAASIAHGCASTFAAVWADGALPHWYESWCRSKPGFDYAAFRKQRIQTGSGSQRRDGENVRYEVMLTPSRVAEKKKDGICFFRADAVCPFSKNALEATLSNTKKEAGPRERKALLDHVPRIYEACSHAANHRAVQR